MDARNPLYASLLLNGPLGFGLAGSWSAAWRVRRMAHCVTMRVVACSVLRIRTHSNMNRECRRHEALQIEL